MTNQDYMKRALELADNGCFKRYIQTASLL